MAAADKSVIARDMGNRPISASDDELKLLSHIYQPQTLRDYNFSQCLKNTLLGESSANALADAVYFYKEIYTRDLTDKAKTFLEQYINTNRLNKAQQSQRRLGILNTKSDGNCFFHGVYGSNNGAVIIDEQAQERRQQFADWLGKEGRVAFGELERNIFTQSWPEDEPSPGEQLALLLITELNGIGAELSEKALKNYAQQQGLGEGFVIFYRAIREEWQDIMSTANAVQERKNVLKAELINLIIRMKTELTDNEINEDLDGIVNKILAGAPSANNSAVEQLKNVYEDYQQQPDAGDTQREMILLSRSIFSAYQRLVVNQDYYINNIEARLIAYKDNIKIEYYLNQGRDRLIFNSNGNIVFDNKTGDQQQVNAILYNGHHHYYRYDPNQAEIDDSQVRDIEALLIEQAKKESMLAFSGNGGEGVSGTKNYDDTAVDENTLVISDEEQTRIQDNARELGIPLQAAADIADRLKDYGIIAGPAATDEQAREDDYESAVSGELEIIEPSSSSSGCGA